MNRKRSVILSPNKEVGSSHHDAAAAKHAIGNPSTAGCGSARLQSSSQTHQQRIGSLSTAPVTNAPSSLPRSIKPLQRLPNFDTSSHEKTKKVNADDVLPSSQRSRRQQFPSSRCISEPSEMCQISYRIEPSSSRRNFLPATNTSTANAFFPSISKSLSRTTSSTSLRHQQSARSSTISLSPLPNTSASLMTRLAIAHRSISSKAVKQMLTDLNEMCATATELDELEEVEGTSAAWDDKVESRCSALAQLVGDVYYKVVISKNNGVAIICNVMRFYPHNPAIQVSCCTILQSLVSSLEESSGSPSSSSHQAQIAIHEAGGTSLLIQALQNHPTLAHVQSAACNVLCEMSLTLTSPVTFHKYQLQHQQQEGDSSSIDVEEGSDIDCATTVTEQSRHGIHPTSSVVLHAMDSPTVASISHSESIHDLIELLEQQTQTTNCVSGDDGVASSSEGAHDSSVRRLLVLLHQSQQKQPVTSTPKMDDNHKLGGSSSKANTASRTDETSGPLPLIDWVTHDDAVFEF